MRTPLKSFKIIKKMYALFVKKYRELEPKLMICEKEDFNNIENALKDYEMEHTLRIRLENANYELVRKNQENEKKLEAIKDLESKLGIDVITLFNKYIKWQKLDTYNTKENDWVLVLCKDKMNGQLYELPLIAELRNDGKWYTQDDKCLNDYLEVVAWKNIDVIYECGKLTEEFVKDNYVQR